MYQQELESNLALYLEQVVRLMKSNELFRQKFMQSSYTLLFESLDATNKGYITHNDMKKFLKTHKRYFGYEEIVRMMSVYSSDGIAKWTKTEFNNFLLPIDQLSAYLKPDKDPIKIKVAELIANTIHELNTIDVWIDRLESTEEFNVYKCFKVVDIADKGFINATGLYDFLKRFGCSVTIEDCIKSIKRFGVGNQGINYSEFLKRFFPLRKKRPNISTPIKKKVKELLMTPETAATDIKFHSEKSNTRQQDDEAVLKNMKIDIMETKFPQKLPNDYINLLRTQINFNKKIEYARLSLMLQPDFDLLRGYSIFDPEISGTIDEAKLYSGLKALNSKVKIEDIIKFLKNYIKSKNERISYSDFCKLVQSISKKPKAPTFNLQVELEKETKELLRQVVELLIEREINYVEEVERLNKSIYFNPEAIFDLLDYEQNGFLTFNEVILYTDA